MPPICAPLNFQHNVIETGSKSARQLGGKDENTDVHTTHYRWMCRVDSARWYFSRGNRFNFRCSVRCSAWEYNVSVKGAVCLWAAVKILYLQASTDGSHGIRWFETRWHKHTDKQTNSTNKITNYPSRDVADRSWSWNASDSSLRGIAWHRSSAERRGL